MKRILWLVVAGLLLGILVLSSCAARAVEAPPAAKTETTQTAPPPPPKPEPKPTPDFPPTTTPTPVAPLPPPTPPPTPAPIPPPTSAPPPIVHEIIQYPVQERPWTKIPSVTISARADDPRIQLAREAVDFWNQQLAELGTPFRLGTVTQTTELVPLDYLMAKSAATLEGQAGPQFPQSVSRLPGDLIIALSDGDFVSFSTSPGPAARVMVGIRDSQTRPLSLPNVARNAIAHELGHAIGLGHNNDPAKLMCGRPADCRPDAWQSTVERYFPITEVEKAFLLKLYPLTWQPSR